MSFDNFKKFSEIHGSSNELNPLEMEGEETEYPIKFAPKAPVYKADETTGKAVPRLKLRIRAVLKDKEGNLDETFVTLMIKGVAAINYFNERINPEKGTVKIPSIIDEEIQVRTFRPDNSDQSITAKMLWFCIPEENGKEKKN